MRFLFLSLFSLFTLLTSNLMGKEEDTTDKIPNATKSDSVIVARKSPIGAMLRSLAIPGWGQVYVHQYWKAPLFFAGTLVMYYYTFKHNSDFLDYSKQYDDLLKQNPNDPNLYIIKQKRENARDNRDISIFLLCGVYALSMLDAYVDAHLFNFNVSEKLSIQVSPSQNGFCFNVSYLLFKY